jgi:hypothetical protein
MILACRFGCWPAGPFVGAQVWGGLLVVAGVIFSVVMLIDCLKRKPADFVNPLTKNGEYDRLIWAGAIFLSLWFYCVGAIVYFFVVKRSLGDGQREQAEN